MQHHLFFWWNIRVGKFLFKAVFAALRSLFAVEFRWRMIVCQNVWCSGTASASHKSGKRSLDSFSFTASMLWMPPPLCALPVQGAFWSMVFGQHVFLQQNSRNLFLLHVHTLKHASSCFNTGSQLSHWLPEMHILLTSYLFWGQRWQSPLRAILI